MDYLHRVLGRNNYPDWLLKNSMLGYKDINPPSKKLPMNCLYQFPTSQDVVRNLEEFLRIPNYR